MGDRRAMCGLFGMICGKIVHFLGNVYKYMKYICVYEKLFVSLPPNNYFYMRMCADRINNTNVLHGREVP